MCYQCADCCDLTPKAYRFTKMAGIQLCVLLSCITARHWYGFCVSCTIPCGVYRGVLHWCIILALVIISSKQLYSTSW